MVAVGRSAVQFFARRADTIDWSHVGTSPRSVSRAIGLRFTALAYQLADRCQVCLKRVGEVTPLERLRGLDELAQITARAMRFEQRRSAAVIDLGLGQRGVVRGFSQLQVGDQLVDDLGF